MAVSGNWSPLCLILVLPYYYHYASANVEGDALYTFKSNLVDPSGVTSSWNASMKNPCLWYHVTCNSDNSVVRLDLGNANLSGQLAPALGQLFNLQYLELFSNNINGTIPYDLGNLTNLVSLELNFNNLTGPIPNTLGRLTRLRTLRLNNNTLSGDIPRSLTTITTLQIVDLSFNQLSGSIPLNGSFAYFTPISFNGNPNLMISGTNTSNQIPPGSSAGNEIMRRTGWLIYFPLVVLLKLELATFRRYCNL